MGKKGTKLTDEQFFEILRENGGLYARTARAIRTQYGIRFTRQSVRTRALNNPDEVKDIEEENKDVAEEGLHSLMRSKNERVRLRAVELFLKTKGKDRGYVTRTEIEDVGEPKPMQIEVVTRSKNENDGVQREPGTGDS